MSAINIKDVSKNYGSQNVVEDFSLTVKAGERLIILGPSGCGKTTLLRLVAGFIAPDSGDITIGDNLVARAGRNLVEPEQRSVGMVFQDLALWPHMTVKANLEFGLKAQNFPKEQRETRINEILKLVEMENLSSRKPVELSGGEQQRLALARTLVLTPKILLMDEPLSSLDFKLNFQLRKEIIKLHEKLGFTLIHVTHNIEEAFDVAERIVIMEEGRIVKVGTTGEAREHFEKMSQHIL